ncbi:hypothetical protein [Salinimicrobium sp. TH3]|uniref:hypothetical protein n=1 Tax=Salinimicrobium sp. TH3 TaxID=2997342 RepID=UPI002273BD54|nr:hypothetical protein [Salinimicrobium sp. TH3]MCY2686786.1 hypothetical protein [Salinimicrobium sp. TH3]
MKNWIYILILILTTVSCEKFEETSNNQRVYSTDYRSLETESNFEVIDIDSVQNYSELISEMEKLTCQNKISGLKFTFQEKEYFLTGITGCPTKNETACYFARNLIIVKNDSIITDLFNNKKIPIENLQQELNEIASKPFNFQFDKDDIKPALIHLYIEKNENISTTKKVLKEIVVQFDKFNSESNPDFFKYNILFERFDRTKIPPPPPLPKDSSIGNM